MGKSLSKATADLIVTLHQAGRTHRAHRHDCRREPRRSTGCCLVAGRTEAPAKRHAKPAERCPSCGVLRLRAWRASPGSVTHSRSDDSDESDSLAIDLVGSREERYEALRVVKN